MDEDIKKQLEKEEQPEPFQTMLRTTRALIEKSRGDMAQHYKTWDDNLDTFRARRRFTKDDAKAASKRQPVQMILPLTYSQVVTFASFGFMLLLQNEHFYEFKSSGLEDELVEADLENLLDRDVKKNSWPILLFMFILDTARLNMGVLEAYWTRETVTIPIETEVPPAEYMDEATGVMTVGQATKKKEFKEFLKFEGNRVRNISPYKFFPDTNLPLVQYQEGEFCGSEEEFTMIRLKELEHSGMVAGIDHIKPMTPKQWTDRKGETRSSHLENPGRTSPAGSNMGGGSSDTQSPGMVLVTKVQRKLIPSKIKLDGDKPLGDEKWPVMYIIWYANDGRIIRCERSTNVSTNFTYYMASYTPDHLEKLSIGLADLIDNLQSTITWFINSRVTAVRRTLDSKYVVDPNMVDQKTLGSDQPFIILKKGAGPGGVERAIKQLQTSDSTQGHVVDVDMLTKQLQMVSGINENTSGQYHGGRRSAREVGAVQAGESSRLLMHFSLIWQQAFGPLGQDMLTNLRQGISIETVSKVLGKDFVKDPNFAQRFEQIKGTIEDLVGADDYFLMPSTTPGEKGALAATLTELFTAITSSPEMAMATQIDPVALLKEIFRLRGVTHMDQFIKQQVAMPPAPPNVMGMPTQQPMQQQQLPPAV